MKRKPIRYNARRHAKLLRRAAELVEARDWLNFGRCMVLAQAQMPEHLAGMIEAARQRKRVELGQLVPPALPTARHQYAAAGGAQC